MKNKTLEIVWIIISFIVMIVSTILILNANVITNAIGFSIGLIWICISCITQCFTKRKK